MPRMRFSAKQIRAVRKANGMTQTQFAHHMGVSRRTVIRWERTGVDWSKYAFEAHQFRKLEQPELPLDG